MAREVSTTKQVALHLATRVTEGGVFTMESIRAAIPGVSQVDRRMRDLRPLGWTIDTYKTDPTLAPDELRVTKIGDRIWDPAAPKRLSTSVNARVRRQVFDRDHNTCQCCGIHAGEEYELYAGITARMTLGHYVPKSRGGSTTDPSNMRAECAMCNEANRHLTPSTVDERLLRAQIENMPKKDKTTIARWLAADKREWSTVEQVWAQLRQLPAPVRDDIAATLAAYL